MKTFSELNKGDRFHRLTISDSGEIEYSYLMIDDIEYNVPPFDPLENGNNYTFISGFWSNDRWRDINSLNQMCINSSISFKTNTYERCNHINSVYFTEYSFYNEAKKMLIESFIPFIEKRIKEREKDIQKREELLNELSKLSYE